MQYAIIYYRYFNYNYMEVFMRHLVLIVLLILLAIPLLADNLVFNYDLILAYLPLNTLFQWENSTNLILKANENPLLFYIDLNAEVVLFDTFFIGGNMRNDFYNKSDSLYFSPQTMRFKFFTGLRFKKIFEIGFNHFCFHPVIPYFGLHANPIVKWEGAYEEIYIKISGSTKKR